MSNQQNHDHFPWSHVIGFASSIVLTLIAVWVALYSSFTTTMILWTILILALVQAGIQLFMFMHIREGDSNTQIGTMVYSAIIGVIIVGGSVWVMNAMMSGMNM
ncbi:cytochrome aa3 quinol oxidase subunit IV [Pontibacillus salicampi]|uniref:Quinol oxidase subunit 4 n=1 Tax=Pontibacillus salicampi TaxID=1449801 RepID=A0ABV6LIM5_9BACI